jgi:hypothetical protein
LAVSYRRPAADTARRDLHQRGGVRHRATDADALNCRRATRSATSPRSGWRPARGGRRECRRESAPPSLTIRFFIGRRWARRPLLGVMDFSGNSRSLFMGSSRSLPRMRPLRATMLPPVPKARCARPTGRFQQAPKGRVPGRRSRLPPRPGRCIGCGISIGVVAASPHCLRSRCC